MHFTIRYSMLQPTAPRFEKDHFQRSLDASCGAGQTHFIIFYITILSIMSTVLDIRLRPSETLTKLYNKLRAIQVGDEADPHGRMRDIA